MDRKCFKVYGIVQGINFRRDTCKMANDLGLCGTVRNLSDKSVEIEVIGSLEAINSLIISIKSDFVRAKVDKIEFKSVSKIKKFDEFIILY